MLKTRIITAICLVTVFSLAVFILPPAGWIVFSAAIAALAAWEWGALMRMDGRTRRYLGAGLLLVCLVISVLADPVALGLESSANAAHRMRSLSRWFYFPALAFWLLVVPFWLKRRWPLPSSFPGILVGLLVLVPTWLALVQLRQIGGGTLIAVMATVWVADIGAYFFGRTLGKRKLAPAISPGKTWEGAIGGGVMVVLYGLVLSSKLPVGLAGNTFLLLFVLFLLPIVSVIGDLFESLLKRQAGLKDSSGILPGHGGILDRIDSLTSTLPMIALTWLYSLP